MGDIVFKIFPRKQGTFPELFFGFRTAALFFETLFFGVDQKNHFFFAPMLGASPPGCGAADDLVAVPPPCDPMGRPPSADAYVPAATARVINARW